MSKLREVYKEFCESGESGRSNLNELLKALVDAVESDKKPEPKPKEK